VFINARINGDLLAGCGEITVKDSVLEDAAIGSGNARIEGPIGGDLRIGAGDVTIGLLLNIHKKEAPFRGL
jgi:hypothetical protein